MISYKGLPTSLTERQLSATQNKEERVPKRILHFSDGTLEEFSSDDEDESDIEPRFVKRTSTEVNAINPATLAWLPWMIYQSTFFGGRALAICDYFGEFLANFFGIITPKYEYEIEHYKRMVEEEKEKKKQDVELGGWKQSAKKSVVFTEQLKTVES